MILMTKEHDEKVLRLQSQIEKQRSSIYQAECK
jgi:hypothetical protein